MISGYKLYIDDGFGGDFRVIFNTVGFNSDINEYLVSNLTAALQYRFIVEPYNYNVLQPGAMSDIAYIYACGIPKLSERPK